MKRRTVLKLAPILLLPVSVLAGGHAVLTYEEIIKAQNEWDHDYMSLRALLESKGVPCKTREEYSSGTGWNPMWQDRVESEFEELYGSNKPYNDYYLHLTW